MHNLQPLRDCFDSGITRPYAWRRQQLQKMRQMIIDQETAISTALYTDLKKSPEEAYGTEIGLVRSEISHMLKHLKGWMRPRRAGTNLVNWPSSSTVYRDPLGVVFIIAPWNYPFQLSLLPVAAALAAGNTVVLKPSELAPATAAILEKILTATFGQNIVRVVCGDGATLVPQLIKDFRFDHIFFTGSVPVGRAIYQLAAEQLIPVTLELGGKSPVVIAEDADIPTTARRIVFGKFTNAGQTCIAPDYLLVHAAVKDKLLSQLVSALKGFYGEHPEESPDYGKIINEKRFDTLVGFLSHRGTTILYGGDHRRDKLFIAPTILETTPEHPLMKEEIFGPLLPVVTYHTLEEALAVIRQNPNPLAFYLFTRDKRAQKAWIEALSFGGGCINNTDWHFANPNLPFGGIGNSGIGAYHGKHSFDTFTHAKSVMRTPVFPDPDIKYPPFKGKMKWVKLFLK